MKRHLLPILTVLCAALLLSGCEEQETMQYVYEEEGAYFSIELPLDWTVEVNDGWPAVSGPTPEESYEASPDAGLFIYVEGKKEDKTAENQIYFYRQYGTISASLPLADEKVQIGDSYYATHYRSERNGLILEEFVFQKDNITGGNSYAISITLPRKVYNRHRKEIEKAVNSVYIK